MEILEVKFEAIVQDEINNKIHYLNQRKDN